MDQETETITEATPQDAPAPTKRRSRTQAPDTQAPPAPREPESSLKVARGLSWVRFIYPFSFEAKDFDSHVKIINDGVLDETSESTESELDNGWTLVSWRSSKGEADDVGGDLLPHVSRFLGEPQEVSHGPVPPRTAYMWALNDSHLERVLGVQDGVRWSLRLWKKNIRFEVDEVQLSMFRHGLGFLTFSAKPVEESAREGALSTWLDFIYGMRYLRGKPYTNVGAIKDQVTENGETRARRFPEGTASALPPAWAEGGDIFLKLICPLLQTATIQDPIWWEEVFVPGQLIPYVALFVDRKPKNGPLPEAELFDLIYRLRNVVADRQHISMSVLDRTFDHPDLLPYADYMWFYFSLAAGGFLAYNAPTTGPYRSTMPKRYLKDEYFLAFLLTLQQRFVLGVITNQIAEHWLPSGDADRADHKGWRKQLSRLSNIDDRRSTQFDDLLEGFLMFSARGHFAQLMQGEHHQLYYKKWQDKFQIKELFEEVKNELEGMHNYLEMVVQERVDFVLHVLTALSIILGVIGTIAGWWALNLDNISTTLAKWGWPNWIVWFSFLLIVPLLALGIFFFSRMGWFAPRRRK